MHLLKTNFRRYCVSHGVTLRFGDLALDFAIERCKPSCSRSLGGTALASSDHLPDGGCAVARPEAHDLFRTAQLWSRMFGGYRHSLPSLDS